MNVTKQNFVKIIIRVSFDRIRYIFANLNFCLDSWEGFFENTWSNLVAFESNSSLKFMVGSIFTSTKVSTMKAIFISSNLHTLRLIESVIGVLAKTFGLTLTFVNEHLPKETLGLYGNLEF